MNQELCEPAIVVRGDVPDEAVVYAREKLHAIVARLAVPVLHAELRLDRHADPARDRPNHVEVTVDLDGTPICARRSAPTMSEAIDRALERLHGRIDAAKKRSQTRRRRFRDIESWHHGDQRTESPGAYPRPVEDRMLVRRKTFALGSESIEEALYDLETLDHDFFLFVHDETDAEAVVFRSGEQLGLMQRVPTPDAITGVGIPLTLGPHPASRTLENALRVLDETDAPFEFFVDSASGHGIVVYRRYDGDYGLITAA